MQPYNKEFGEELLSEFTQCVTLYDDYYRRQDALGRDFNRDVTSEARRRLVQLRTIIQKVVTFELECSDATSPFGLDAAGFPVPVSREVGKRLVEIGDELQFYTEAFYYFAFRLRCIFRDLPNLARLECKGVRDVRNKLLEHPEGRDSNVFLESFGE
jgi:hypothetical protein